MACVPAASLLARRLATVIMTSPDPIPTHVERARVSLSRRLEEADGLVGVGIAARAKGELELLVLVRAAGCEAERRAPASYQGCPVRVEISGRPRKQPGRR
jgi:hypothetical protein